MSDLVAASQALANARCLVYIHTHTRACACPPPLSMPLRASSPPKAGAEEQRVQRRRPLGPVPWADPLGLCANPLLKVAETEGAGVAPPNEAEDIRTKVRRFGEEEEGQQVNQQPTPWKGAPQEPPCSCLPLRPFLGAGQQEPCAAPHGAREGEGSPFNHQKDR